MATVADIPSYSELFTRLRCRLAPPPHEGFGFSCGIETAKGLQKPESLHQR